MGIKVMRRPFGALLLGGSALADKTVLTESGRLASVPLVSNTDYGCQEWCFFKDEVESGRYNQWCL